MAEVITDSTPTEDDSIIVLGAESWCQPCRNFAPVFARAAAQHDGDIKFFKVDIDDNPELAEKYGVQSVPTVIRARDGELEYVTERRPMPFIRYVESLSE